MQEGLNTPLQPQRNVAATERGRRSRDFLENIQKGKCYDRTSSIRES